MLLGQRGGLAPQPTCCAELSLELRLQEPPWLQQTLLVEPLPAHMFCCFSLSSVHVDFTLFGITPENEGLGQSQTKALASLCCQIRGLGMPVSRVLRC